MVELNPYVRSQLYRSSTGTTLLNRLETSRSVNGGSGGSSGYIGSPSQETNIITSSPKTSVGIVTPELIESYRSGGVSGMVRHIASRSDRDSFFSTGSYSKDVLVEGSPKKKKTGFSSSVIYSGTSQPYTPEELKKYENRHLGGIDVPVDEFRTDFSKKIDEMSSYPSRETFEETGKYFKGFDPNVPVEIEGETYPGKSAVYEVENFNPYFLFGIGSKVSPRLVEKGFTGTTKTMSAVQYDKYLENMGNYYLNVSKNVPTSIELANIQAGMREYLSGSYDWGPGTKVRRYDPFYFHVSPDTNKLVRGRTPGVSGPGTSSYLTEFPYAGWEHYYTYKNLLEKNPGQATALGWGWGGRGNVDIAVYRLTGDKSAELRANIPRLARYDYARQSLARGDIGGFSAQYWTGYLNSPATRIGLAYAGAELMGGGYGAVQGYLTQTGRYSALQSINRLGLAALIGGSTIELSKVYRSYQSGDVGKALGELNLFAAEFTAGWKGFAKGQTASFKYGSQKGYESFLKTSFREGRISSDQYSTLLGTSRARYNIEKSLSKMGFTEQDLASFNAPKTLQDEPSAVDYLTGKVPSTKHHKILGSFSRNKPGMKDIDIQLLAKQKVFFEKSLKLLTGGTPADIHRLQRPGEIVGEFGAVSQKPYVHKTILGKVKTSKFIEEWGRLSGSSLRPAHSGRIKDISESIRTLDLITGGKNISPSLQSNIDVWKTGMMNIESWGASNPMIHSKESFSYLYGGKGLKEFIYQKKVDFWSGRISDADIRADIAKYINLGKTSKLNISSGYLPPSISSSFSSSQFFGGMSSFFSPSSSIGGSVSKSFSISPSFSASFSNSFSKSVSIVSPSKSISSIIDSSSISHSIVSSIGRSPSIGSSISNSISKSISSISHSVSPSVSSSISVVPSGFFRFGYELYGKSKKVRYPSRLFDLGYKFREFRVAKLFENI